VVFTADLFGSCADNGHICYESQEDLMPN